MNTVFEEVVRDPLPFLDGIQKIPVPPDLSSQLDRPSMEEAVVQHVSRFSQGGSESNILPSSIRKLPFYAQHHTWRDDDTYTSTKETPAPADKPPVGQVSALPAEREGERKNIVCFSIFVHRSCFFFYNIHYTVWLCNALNSWCYMDVS